MSCLFFKECLEHAHVFASPKKRWFIQQCMWAGKKMKKREEKKDFCQPNRTPAPKHEQKQWIPQTKGTKVSELCLQAQIIILTLSQHMHFHLTTSLLSFILTFLAKYENYWWSYTKLSSQFHLAQLSMMLRRIIKNMAAFKNKWKGNMIRMEFYHSPSPPKKKTKTKQNKTELSSSITKLYRKQ